MLWTVRYAIFNRFWGYVFFVCLCDNLFIHTHTKQCRSKQHQLLLFLKNKQFTMIAIKHKAEHENRKQDTAVNDGKCCSG